MQYSNEKIGIELKSNTQNQIKQKKGQLAVVNALFLLAFVSVVSTFIYLAFF
ncbi:hypothetical protein ACWOFR_13515 [Carnobacterium gallinarum]|uniref:hypothetical protein n=1 Tax=Carnobacterium gallinarum TaxID=2749 RepID=UPI000A53DEA2|nr:hypothetical protein [Carnobacterium gallinarum]